MKLFRLALANFLLLLLITFQINAQSDDIGTFQIGLRMGAVVSEFSNSQPHTSEKLGFTVGVVVEYAFSDRLSVQVEPAYLQQGGSYVRFTDKTRFGDDSNMNSVYVTNSEVTLHTADLPVLAKFKFPAIGAFTPNIVLGPSTSYLFRAGENFDRTYHYNNTYATANGYYDISTQYESLQVAATAGIGGEVSLGNKRLLIDLRYKHGITPAKKSFSYIDLYSVQGDLTTNSYYFTIGLGL